MQLKLPFKGKLTQPTLAKENQGLGSLKIGGWIIDGNDLLAGRSYWFVLIVLVVLILMMGVWTNEQIQERHRLYRELSFERQAYQKMQTEAQRLIIEQQTFSATPTVAGRAVNELNMFYPTQKHRLVVAEPTK